MAEPRISIIPTDDQYDESWKLALLASRPDSIADALDDVEPDDGSALAALMDASGGNCWYCGCQMIFGRADVPNGVTREHLLPRARGGSNTSDNIVAACRACNVSKQAKTVEEYRAYCGGIAFFGETSR